MTKEKQKKKIIELYGTLSNFARNEGIDRNRVTTYFNPKVIGALDVHIAIDAALKKAVAVDTLAPDPKKMKKLFDKIEKAGGAAKFCRATGFSYQSTHNLMSGKVTRMSSFIRKLFDHFGIKN